MAGTLQAWSVFDPQQNLQLKIVSILFAGVFDVFVNALMLTSIVTISRLTPCSSTLPPLHLRDVRKLPDKSVTYLKLLMLLHLNREGPPSANGKQKFPLGTYRCWDLIRYCIDLYTLFGQVWFSCFLSSGAILRIHSLHLGASVSFAREVSYHDHCPYSQRNHMLRIVLFLVVMCQKPIICHDSPDCLRLVRSCS